MTNLTEHGKPQLYGYYYVEFNNGKQGIKQFGEFANTWKPKKTFCEVPSYEQWQKHRKTLLKTQEKNCDLEIKNKQLKELLKECREHLKYIVICPQNKKIVEKLDQVLGEE